MLKTIAIFAAGYLVAGAVKQATSATAEIEVPAAETVEEANQIAADTADATASTTAGYIAYNMAMSGGGKFKTTLSGKGQAAYGKYLRGISNENLYRNVGAAFARSPNAHFRAAGQSALHRNFANRLA